MARWVVTASRVLRVYVSDPKPSKNLRTMAEYVLSVYAPILFEIKHLSSIVYGPIHLAKLIKSSRMLPPEWLKIVNSSIQRNAYFAHPEHIVLAMTNDDNEHIRKMAWNRVLAARREVTTGKPVRQFKIPKLNFDCDDYKSMIDLPSTVDPPMLRDVHIDSENIDFLASKKILDHDFGSTIRDMPLHTQADERCVKMVTEASKSVCGECSRDGHISNKLVSRQVMEQFESKKD